MRAWTMLLNDTLDVAAVTEGEDCSKNISLWRKVMRQNFFELVDDDWKDTFQTIYVQFSQPDTKGRLSATDFHDQPCRRLLIGQGEQGQTDHIQCPNHAKCPKIPFNTAVSVE